MSETVRVRAKLIPLGEATEKLVATALHKEGYLDKPDNFDTHIQYMHEEAYEDFAKIGNQLYKIEELEEAEYHEEFCDVGWDGDGNLLIHTMFYNGAACWQEMVEDKLKK